MRVSVFGLGYVGSTIAGCLSSAGHKVIGVDINKEKVGSLNKGRVLVSERRVSGLIRQAGRRGRISATLDPRLAVQGSDISIICVSTPLSQNGELNLNNVFKVAGEIAKGIRLKKDFHIVAIKSTVSPGTNRKVSGFIERISGKKNNKAFCVVSNPEFLREGQAVNDYYRASFVILGTDNPRAAAAMKKLYAHLRPRFEIVEAETAEMLKYACNGFHALKISFANEIGNICQGLGIDSNRLMDIFCKDRRLNISANYLKPRFAYGGSCLPRDAAVLNSLSRRQRLKSPLLAALASSNEAQKGRLLRLIKKLKKKRIGFLGITFKAGTDDLRNSPVLEVMRLLLRGGYGLSAFDEAIDARKLIGINKIHLERIIPRYKEILAGDIDAVLAGADLLVLNHNPGAATIKKIRLFLRRKRVIDLACVPELAKSRNYIGFNW